MRTVAVVPVKGLDQAKSRLSSVLSPHERASLTLNMLSHVLDVIEESGVIQKIGVISPEAGRLHLPDSVTLIRQARPGLNYLLEQGRDWAIQEEADALMVVFADLPLLKPEDVSAIAQLGKERGTVVLASDRHGQGTNVMLSNPPTLARFAFGTASYNKHYDLAREVGARVEAYVSPGTTLDVDTPDDLSRLESEVLALNCNT